jgi:hypothetical protein
MTCAVETGGNTRVGDRVRFSRANVFLPEPQEPDPNDSSSESECEGTIVAFSDAGAVPMVFAVIETVQARTVVVPVDQLRLEPSREEGGKE